MSASADSRSASNRGEIGLEADLTSLKLPLSEIMRINSRHGGCCADLPLGERPSLRRNYATANMGTVGWVARALETMSGAQVVNSIIVFDVPN